MSAVFTRSMLQRIEQEWRSWAATPRAALQLADWADERTALRGWELADLHRPRSSPRTDAMQAALVQLSQGGDHAAVSTLLTQLCPGLWHIVGRGRKRRSGCDAVQPDDVAAIAYETIMLHRLDRRPRAIAANIVLDTRQRLWRASVVADRRACSMFPQTTTASEPRARRLHQQPPCCAVDQPEVRVADLDLLGRLATAIEGSTGDHRSQQLSAEIAYRAWILDEAAPSIADAVGLRPDAVRARLSRLRTAVRVAGQSLDVSECR